jgi:hypothetical protein
MANDGSSAPSLSTIAREDLLFLIAGVLAFIFSFIDFAHIDVSGVGTVSGSSISAWHGTGAIGGVLVLLSVGTAALTVFSPGSLDDLPLPARVIAEGLAALALLFFIIRWLTLPSTSFFGQHFGYVLAWGGYVTLILVVVQIIVGFFAIRAAGDSWQPSSAARPPVPPAGPPSTSAEPWTSAASPPPPPEAAPPAPEPPQSPEPPPADAGPA